MFGRNQNDDGYDRELADEASRIEYHSTDELLGKAQETPGVAWHEPAFDARADQQQHGWLAKGWDKVREPLADAAASKHLHTVQLRSLAAAEKARDQAYNIHAMHEVVLAPYQVRGPHAFTFYLIFMIVLSVGDAVGVASGAITNGELIPLAIIQGLASGGSAYSAGRVGAEVRHLYLAHRRVRQENSATLSPEHRGYEWLLQEPTDAARRIILGLVITSVVIALFIALAIFWLRATVSGDTSIGWIYGGLAAGVAGGSFLNAFLYADEVADKREAARHDYHSAEAYLLNLQTRLSSISEHERAAATVTATQTEYGHRAAAAADFVNSLKWVPNQRHPELFGHLISAERLGEGAAIIPAGPGFIRQGQAKQLDDAGIAAQFLNLSPAEQAERTNHADSPAEPDEPSGPRVVGLPNMSASDSAVDDEEDAAEEEGRRP
jgi:hypothetical protein